MNIAIATINGKEILVGNDPLKLVPIRPICEALGVDFAAQQTKLKDDDILGSVVGLSPTVGADGKQREMLCLPLEYIYGWLFTINPKNVKPEAQQSVATYRKVCYNTLYRYFFEQVEFNEQKQQAVSLRVNALEQIRQEFNSAKDRLAEAKKQLNTTLSVTYEQWRHDRAQLQLFSPAEQQGEPLNQ